MEIFKTETKKVGTGRYTCDFCGKTIGYSPNETSESLFSGGQGMAYAGESVKHFCDDENCITLALKRIGGFGATIKLSVDAIKFLLK